MGKTRGKLPRKTGAEHSQGAPSREHFAASTSDADRELPFRAVCAHTTGALACPIAAQHGLAEWRRENLAAAGAAIKSGREPPGHNSTSAQIARRGSTIAATLALPELALPAGDVASAGSNVPCDPAVPAAAAGRDERWWVTTFTAPTMVTKCMTRDQVPAFDTSRFRFYYDPARGDIKVVRPSGRPIQYGSALRGVGQVSLRIPFGLMTRPGQRMTPFEVAALVGLSTLQIHRNFQQRFKAARRAFGEGGRADGAEEICFLLSEAHPYLVWWNHACGFAAIEPASWLEYARQHPGCGCVLFHSVLFGDTQIRNVG